MTSLKTAFARTAFGAPGSDTFWLLIWAIFIADEAQRREEQRRERKAQAQRPHRPKPPAGPRPF